MSNEYRIHLRMPTIEEYKELCHAVGWTNFMNFSVAEDSLRQSLFGVVIQLQDDTIGMGRIVGDGKMYFYIQDIAVLPEHQNKGVGRMIMDVITTYLTEHAPEKSFIGLFATKGKESFYQPFGFHNHDGMTGMFGVIHESKVQ
ncbi:GNAT family N-acetyltransferase [Paenibacillus sp. HB172176]|uniref:GNAT family N-acetyltransferase n=1 Tax=Paenibacillus sp. HB172176 TaxID=2493690 RepID=UPI00143AD2FF|nr:GNAT family N-acetyltransferase [Paenibacillus sp. HB172176]